MKNPKLGEKVRVYGAVFGRTNAYYPMTGIIEGVSTHTGQVFVKFEEDVRYWLYRQQCVRIKKKKKRVPREIWATYNPNNTDNDPWKRRGHQKNKL